MRSSEALPQNSPQDSDFSAEEVAEHLNVSADTLHYLSRRFGRYLSAGSANGQSSYTAADIAALVAIQRLLAQGYNDDQIDRYLTPVRHAGELQHGAFLPPAHDPQLPSLVGDVLTTLVNNQQAILTGQASLREVIGVVVQDNFNLKDENRKLRERMLEIERVLAEYQRREETRKERMENRLRALEATVAALQQQLAQLVNLQRELGRRRGWF